MSSFLDLLAAEWFSYRERYCTRVNVPLRKRAKGGHEGDADVIGIPPINSGLPVIHVEASQAAQSLKTQLPVLKRKFEKAADDYRELTGVTIDEVKKIVIAGWAKELGNDIKEPTLIVYTVPLFMKMVTDVLKGIDPWKNAIPETFPILRAIQYALWYGEKWYEGAKS